MEDDPVPPNPPTYDDIEDAINRLKNNKAVGEDGIPAKLLKYGSEDFHKALYNIILTVWIKEGMPGPWKKAMIHPLHKKQYSRVHQSPRYYPPLVHLQGLIQCDLYETAAIC